MEARDHQQKLEHDRHNMFTPAENKWIMEAGGQMHMPAQKQLESAEEVGEIRSKMKKMRLAVPPNSELMGDASDEESQEKVGA